MSEVHDLSRILQAYLPEDRYRALVYDIDLPDRTSGSVVLADISGFTPLAEALVRAYGRLRGAEELTQQLHRVYDTLIPEVGRQGGSVIGFSGDAITCWFDIGVTGNEAASRALTCSLSMQDAIRRLAPALLPGGITIKLSMTTAVASGPAAQVRGGRPHHSASRYARGSDPRPYGGRGRERP